MKARSVAQINKEIAELDRLLGEEGYSELPLYDVPVKRGLVLANALNEKLRPFIIKYTALVNRKQAYVTVDVSKLQEYVPLAEELSRCEDIMLGMYGIAYKHALKLIINGFEDAEEGVHDLFWAIKMTDDYKGIKNLFTRIEGGFNGVAVVKDSDAEE
ncbi:hypothetical protein ACQCVB_17725 [Fictibacillus phosphorivorans]|uniref:hypothetical protein n=1 Tax=Fictibacillus phosphorivorans TaxID=1221500 RepID=UPI003CFBB21D